MKEPESIIHAVDYYLKDFRDRANKGGKDFKPDMYKDIGYDEEFHKIVRAKEENLIDKIFFLFKKQSRDLNLQNVVIDASALFMEALLEEEGRDLMRFLEEHIPSKPMIYYFLFHVYERFETRHIFPILISAKEKKK